MPTCTPGSRSRCRGVDVEPWVLEPAPPPKLRCRHALDVGAAAPGRRWPARRSLAAVAARDVRRSVSPRPEARSIDARRRRPARTALRSPTTALSSHRRASPLLVASSGGVGAAAGEPACAAWLAEELTRQIGADLDRLGEAEPRSRPRTSRRRSRCRWSRRRRRERLPGARGRLRAARRGRRLVGVEAGQDRRTDRRQRPRISGSGSSRSFDGRSATPTACPGTCGSRA